MIASAGSASVKTRANNVSVTRAPDVEDGFSPDAVHGREDQLDGFALVRRYSRALGDEVAIAPRLACAILIVRNVA